MAFGGSELCDGTDIIVGWRRGFCLLADRAAVVSWWSRHWYGDIDGGLHAECAGAGWMGTLACVEVVNPMRYRLRTLLIVLTLGPVVLAMLWYIATAPPMKSGAAVVVLVLLAAMTTIAFWPHIVGKGG
jgi:hypothetical protein